MKLTICKPIKQYPIDRNVMWNLKPGEQVTKIFIQSANGREWGVGGGEEIPQSLLIGVEPMAFWLLAYIRGTQQRFPPYLYFENTFWVLQSSFRSLEIPSKWRYRICICSVILGDFELFRNY